MILKMLNENFSIENLTDHKIYQEKVNKYIDSYIENIEDSILKNLVFNAMNPGRRLRPILFLRLVSKLSNSSDFKEICLALELVHRASIILDDLLDKDTKRRNVDAFYIKYGEQATILTAHYLTSCVFKELSVFENLNKSKIIEVFADSYMQMSISEMADLSILQPDTSFCDFYFNKAIKKTSSLFESIFHIYSLVTNQSERNRFYLNSTGNKIGQMYQIYNDIYDDVLASEDERGEKFDWYSNLTILRSVALDTGNAKEKEIIRLSLLKQATKETFIQSRKILIQNKFMLPVKKILEGMAADLDINQHLLDESTIYTINNFKNWLAHSKFWNQNELVEAGY